jgi:hypothetical protein
MDSPNLLRPVQQISFRDKKFCNNFLVFSVHPRRAAGRQRDYQGHSLRQGVALFFGHALARNCDIYF